MRRTIVSLVVLLAFWPFIWQTNCQNCHTRQRVTWEQLQPVYQHKVVRPVTVGSAPGSVACPGGGCCPGGRCSKPALPKAPNK